MSNPETPTSPHLPPLPFSRGRTIWKLRCPECGHGALLAGLLRPHGICPHCGHDFSGYAGADGPAYIAICVVSTVVVVLAAWVELAYEPPYWLHALLWFPLILGASILCLRFAKGWIVAAHYANRIREPQDLDAWRARFDTPATPAHHEPKL